MQVQEAVKLTKKEQQILDSVMPGQEGWHLQDHLECLKSCPSHDRCGGQGPDGKVCSDQWRDASLDEDSTKVFVHVLRNFDFYNQGDLPGLAAKSDQVTALRFKFLQSMDGLASQEYAEGSLRLTQHRRRERVKGLSLRLKWERFDQTGKLECEACAIDFFAVYGEAGFRVIECHHQIPLSHENHKGKTKLEDLALLCANCHRLAHSDELLHGIDALKEYVREMSAAGR
ncbi:HNH endonuclease [Pseudomonas sp. B21-015]|uniref:HNH endonuclease n=1 Tax=Pseudomonas sp. B21-015 TaxID=2895473 RepID=UPI00215DDD37|nr:HNH endonuclease [Pseudomonas sp. B21-015]UVM53161.1 HNH endonuclease [Pseudomonas sp. B21-015]